MEHPRHKPPVVATVMGSHSDTAPAPASGERLRAFDVAEIGMGLLALDGRWLSANAALCAYLGRTEEEIQSISLEDVTHPDDYATDLRELDRLRDREVTVYEREKRVLHLSGAPVWVLQEVRASFDNGGRPIHFIWQGRDVTERRSGRRTRTEADALLRSVVSLAPVVIWAVDPDGIFTLSEGGALATMGLDARRMAVGRSAFDLYRDVRMIESGGRSTTGESLLRRALAGGPAAGLAEIGNARYDITMVPVIGFAGEIAGVIGVAADASERVAAEVRLRQRDRLIAVGTLAAGVAHEIDTPLSSVVKSLDFVAQLLRACAERCRAADLISGPSVADALREPSTALEYARESSARVRRIARDLATFARGGSEHRALLDVRAILAPVVNLVSNEIRKHARLVWDLRDVPLVDVNEARLGQVLVSLLVNAAQAIPEGETESNEIGVATYTDEAGRAVCEVRDTGSGISADVVSRIFDPFFSGRPGGPSPGLGLSICHGIVTALGGELSVRSVPGAGSVFRVAIPAATVGRAR